MKRALAILAALCIAASPLRAEAILMDGRYAVQLEAQDSSAVHVASITVSNGRYSVEMKREPFDDYFLSMRPFRCLAGTEKLWCHVPYPYEIARRLDGDATDLEYDFLFVWKEVGDYGIDLWNGVYYQLEPAGTGLSGVMSDIDLNVLSAPPEHGNLRPVRASDLEPADTQSHWLPQMKITPE